jgi:hypothetical protein
MFIFYLSGKISSEFSLQVLNVIGPFLGLFDLEFIWESLKGTWDGPKAKAHIQIIKSDCPSWKFPNNKFLRKFAWISLENQINLHIILQYL